ncbi:MAG: efflux RND transporter periplasmic adaptor subunit [candidate division Zixibacteria bacterium]|nr:efflux RND transporter periplasmic adaptor subunit [candidate division Zixibacteria bacterium]
MDTTPKIRDDLITKENVIGDGSKYYVIKDPITNAFFKVGEPEYFIISNFDGIKTIPEIAAIFKSKFQVELDDETVNAFIGELQRLCFLDNELTRKELLRQQHLASRDRNQTLFRRLLFIKLKAINPGRLFTRLSRPVHFFFTRQFVWIAIILMFFSLLITLYNTRELAEDFAGLFNFGGIVVFYITMFSIVVLHEFAHGLTCTYYGGEVRDIGFLLLYFQPAFYCNVSDAWLFTEKAKKLWVSFSGGFFQLFIWALAVIAWRVTASDTLINQISLAALSFAGIASLFNFNPLLRYDGYYLLSDYLEIPNLRKKAGKYWRDKFRRLFLGSHADSENFSYRERRIYFYYGLLSFIYIVFVLGYFFLLVGKFLVSRLGGTGFLIFAAILVFLFRNIIMDAAKGTGELVRAKSGIFRRWPVRIGILAFLVIIILFIFLGRWQLRVKGELVLNPLQSLLLKYNSAGYAELIHYDVDNRFAGQQREISSFTGDYATTRLLPLVTSGDTVIAGQVVARLVNTQTAQLVNEYSALFKEAEEQLSLLKQGPRPQEIEQARNNFNEMEAQLRLSTQNLQRMNEMLDKNLISKQAWEDAQADSMIWDARHKAARSKLWMLKAGSRPEEIKAKEAEIVRLKSQMEFHSQRQQSSEIKTSINGIIIRVDTGETVCEIANLDTMEARITLSEKELADITVGQKVKFKVRSFPALNFYGEISRINSKVEIDAKGNRIVQVSCRIPNQGHTLKPGMTGVANVYCGQRPISYHIYRKFLRTIRTEFWDWFDWL